jgi:hypothetical protein
MQEAQGPIGMTGAQPIERGLAARKRCIERGVGNAVRADGPFTGKVDGLGDHGRCLADRGGKANGAAA